MVKSGLMSTAPRYPSDADAPFCYGWRYVTITPHYAAVVESRVAAIKRAQQAEREARTARRQAAAAKRRAQAEAEARAVAEARIRELEAQLKRRKRFT
jgi:hypothetical protein